MASRVATARTVAIVAGLVLALVAAVLLWRYVRAADQRALEGATIVDVFVATAGIAEGTTTQTAVQQDLIEVDQVPNDVRPPGAVTNIEDLNGLAAAAPIQPGAILQLGMFADPTELATQFRELREGEVAISLQVGIPEGVAGNLSQGDQVAIITHIDAQLATTTVTTGPDGGVIEATEQPEVSVTTSQYLTDAEILSVGQRVATTTAEGETAPQNQQDTGSTLVTLAVTLEDAERLVFANNEGIFHFTLLPEGAELGDTPGVTFDSLFPR